MTNDNDLRAYLQLELQMKEDSDTGEYLGYIFTTFKKIRTIINQPLDDEKIKETNKIIGSALKSVSDTIKLVNSNSNEAYTCLQEWRDNILPLKTDE